MPQITIVQYPNIGLESDDTAFAGREGAKESKNRANWRLIWCASLARPGAPLPMRCRAPKCTAAKVRTAALEFAPPTRRAHEEKTRSVHFALHAHSEWSKTKTSMCRQVSYKAVAVKESEGDVLLQTFASCSASLVSPPFSPFFLHSLVLTHHGQRVLGEGGGLQHRVSHGRMLCGGSPLLLSTHSEQQVEVQ